MAYENLTERWSELVNGGESIDREKILIQSN
jgi:hypothetical protein